MLHPTFSNQRCNLRRTLIRTCPWLQKWEKVRKCAHLDLLVRFYQQDPHRLMQARSALDWLEKMAPTAPVDPDGVGCSPQAFLHSLAVSHNGKRRYASILEAFPTYYDVRMG